MQVSEQLSKKTILLINFFLFQSLMVAFVSALAWTDMVEIISIPRHYIIVVIVICSLAVGVGSIIIVRELTKIGEKERRNEKNAVYLEESRQLIDVLRAHRHDFLNHIQVIYGLAQMNKLDRMAVYINELADNMRAEADVSRLAVSELAAFLIKKAATAAGESIKFEIDVDSDLANLGIASTESISVVGNLLDNAFYAACQGTNEDRRVLFMVCEEADRYRITVSNSGQPIPENVKEKIFAKGFTTKGDQGSGLGLFITKSLLEKNGGSLNLLEGGELTTCFEAVIPKART